MSEISPQLFFCLLGLVLIGIELVVFQLSVIWLLFIGTGALVASGLGWLLGWQDWTYLTATFVIASALVTLVLYRPLRRWQQQPGPIAGNDAIGQQVQVKVAIAPGEQGKVSWSGTDWPAVLDDENGSLQSGERAYILAVTGIRLTVSKTPPERA